MTVPAKVDPVAGLPFTRDYFPLVAGKPYDPLANGGAVQRLDLYATAARTGTPVASTTTVAQVTSGQYRFSVPAVPAATYYTVVTAQETSSAGSVFADSLGTIVVPQFAGAFDPAAATYTGQPATVPVDAVRLLINDTDTSDAELTDAVITWQIAQNGNLYRAAAACAEALAARYANYEVGSRTVGDLSVSKTRGSDPAMSYSALAARLRAQAARLSPPRVSAGTTYAPRQFVIGELDADGPQLLPDWLAAYRPSCDTPGSLRP